MIRHEMWPLTGDGSNKTNNKKKIPIALAY